jgi:hypothetical protein
MTTEEFKQYLAKLKAEDAQREALWNRCWDEKIKAAKAEERARRRAMAWYRRFWEDFYWWRVQERFQGEVDKHHSEWLGPEKEPPGGGFG